MSTGSTPSGSGEARLRLPDAMRAELRVPLGDVLTGEPLREAMRTAVVLATVGDVVTAEALDAGVQPAVAVVDFKTERRSDPRLEGRLMGRRVPVPNPPATITPELQEAITEAFKSQEPVTVEVAGEEDLAALVCIAQAPANATVVYGQPGEGAVVVPVDADARRRVADILRRMERDDGD